MDSTISTAQLGAFADLVMEKGGELYRDLPWRNTRDPYAIWLSEVMLQQTQVSTVIPYYQRFLERFPTVSALAEAGLDEVLQYWSGLGYYSRARNLHRCAQAIVSEYCGFFPTEQAILATLPGIGRSTAAAIAVFSAGKKAAIMDGNAVRVLSRVFALTDSFSDASGRKRLWHFAESLLPDTNIESYTQGLMDLGATVCTRSNPQCHRCPFEGSCKARQGNRIAELPVKKAKKSLPLRETIMLIAMAEDRILLEKRPDKGIWGGLYSLPECPSVTGEPVGQTARQYAGAFGTVDTCEPLMPFIHSFTHFRLNILPCIVIMEKASDPLAGNRIWCRKDEALALGLPTPVRKLIESTGRQGGLF
mgnify:CR=1 FL=1